MIKTTTLSHENPNDQNHHGKCRTSILRIVYHPLRFYVAFRIGFYTYVHQELPNPRPVSTDSPMMESPKKMQNISITRALCVYSGARLGFYNIVTKRSPHPRLRKVLARRTAPHAGALKHFKALKRVRVSNAAGALRPTGGSTPVKHSKLPKLSEAL